MPQKQEVKIVFFDIDGTLFKMGQTTASDAVLKALGQLKEKEIKLVIATGRALFKVPEFEGVEFDAVISCNGSLVQCEGKTICRETIPAAAIEKVIRNSADLGHPVAISTKDRFSANGTDQNLIDYFQIAHTPIAADPEFDQIRLEPVFLMMVGCTRDEQEDVMKDVDGAILTAWWDRAADIIPSICSKGNAVKAVLDYFSLPLSSSLAFGDGLNDVPMLQSTGTGVAMDNADAEVKEQADAIAPSVEEDGVALYLQAAGIIG